MFMTRRIRGLSERLRRIDDIPHSHRNTAEVRRTQEPETQLTATRISQTIGYTVHFQLEINTMSEGEQPVVYHPEPQSNIGKWILMCWP